MYSWLSLQYCCITAVKCFLFLLRVCGPPSDQWHGSCRLCSVLLTDPSHATCSHHQPLEEPVRILMGGHTWLCSMLLVSDFLLTSKFFFCNKNSILPLYIYNNNIISHAEAEQTDCSNSSWVIYGLIIVIALLFSGLIWCSLYRVEVSMLLPSHSRTDSGLSK